MNTLKKFLKTALRGCMVSSFVFVCVVLLLVVCAPRGCSTARNQMLAEFRETAAAKGAIGELVADPSINFWREVSDDSPAVLYVPLTGVISSSVEDDFWHGDEGSAPRALADIRLATANASIQGIFLDVDSPGGEVTASDDLWEALHAFRDSDTNRFVVAFFGAEACSGAYYASACADRIVARPTTLTGSIGVRMDSLNIKELADRVGVKSVSIVSGANKNLLGPFEPVTDEHRALVQGLVDQAYERFVSIVSEGRGLTGMEVRGLADGRLFTAYDALEARLIDRVGYLNDALDEVAELAGAEPVYFVVDRPVDIWHRFFHPGFIGACVRAAVPAVDAAVRPAGRLRAERTIHP